MNEFKISTQSKHTLMELQVEKSVLQEAKNKSVCYLQLISHHIIKKYP